MPALTIYLFGTSEKFTSKPSQRNLLTTFANSTMPKPTTTEIEYTTKEHTKAKMKLAVAEEGNNKTMAIDGPGMRGLEVGGNAEFTAQQMYTWLLDALMKKYEDPDEKINVNLACFSRGSVTGKEALNILKQELEKPTIHLSKEEQLLFQENLNRVRFLLYANDPVSGVGDKANPSRIIIPEIKVKYTIDNEEPTHVIPVDHIVTLQKNEMRREFKPQDKSRRHVENFEVTNSVMVPFPGNHSDAMKYKDDATADAAIINANLMYRTLKAHGTKFTEHEVLVPERVEGSIVGVSHMTDMPPMYGHFTEKIKTDDVLDLLKTEASMVKKTVREKGKKITKEEPSGYGEIYFNALTDEQLLERFASAKKNSAAYEKRGGKFSLVDSLPLLSKIKRSFNDQLDYYVDSPDFFMNQFERELFKAVYPKVFNFLFEMGLKADGSHRNEAELKILKDEYIKELVSMKEKNPALFKSLKPLGIKYSAEKDELFGPHDPQGIYKIETDSLTDAVNGKKHKPDFFSHQLETLENEVVQTTMRYQREKDEFMAFFERAHFNEAGRIREQIKRITYGDGQSTLYKKPLKDLSPQEKYNEALDYVKSEYKRLHQIGSDSSLKDRLQNILRHHGYEFYPEEKMGFFQNIAAGFGHTVASIGKLFNGVSNLLSTGFGLPGRFVEDIGRRLDDFKIPLIGTVIEAVGFVVRVGAGIPFLFNLVGHGIQKVGTTVIKASGVYDFSEDETYKPREPKETTLERLHVTKKEVVKERHKIEQEAKLGVSPSPDNKRQAELLPSGPQESHVSDELAKSSAKKSPNWIKSSESQTVKEGEEDDDAEKPSHVS